MSGEPTRSEHRRGVWGTAGQVSKDQQVYFFVTGPALLRLHPDLAADAEASKKYLRPGTMWEVVGRGKGNYRHRRLRLQLTHWNIENARTDPESKAVYLTLREECEGVLDVPAGQNGKAAKVSG